MKIIERWAVMQNTNNLIPINSKPNKHKKNKAAHTPLTLRGWIYAADGKHVEELIQTSFLEFYFTKRSSKLPKNA